MTEEVLVGRCEGRVKWFNPVKGYGFIVQKEKGSHDIFVHYSSIQGDGYKSLKEGDQVEFTLIKGDKGLQAQDVRLIPVEVKV